MDSIAQSTPFEEDPLTPKEEVPDPHYDKSFEEVQSDITGSKAILEKNARANTMGALAQEAPVSSVVDIPTQDVGSQVVSSLASGVRESELRDKLYSLSKSDLPIETKRLLATDYYTEANSPKSVEQDFMKVMANQGVLNASPDNITVQNVIQQNADEIAQAYETRNLYMKGALIDTLSDPASLSGVYDFLESSVMPFSYSPAVVDAIQEVLPEDNTKLWDLIFSGGKQQRFREAISVMPVEKQNEILRRMSEAINNATDNDFVKQQMASALLRVDKMSDTEATLDTIFSSLDFLAAGALARSGYRGAKLIGQQGVKKLLSKENFRSVYEKFLMKDPLSARAPDNSVYSQVVQTAPDRAQAVTYEGIAHPTDEIAKMLGVDKATLAMEAQMPKNLDAIPTPSVALPLDTGHLVGNYTIAELRGVEEKLGKAARVLSNDYSMTTNNMFFMQKGNSLVGEFHILKNDTAGFGRLAEARALAETIKSSFKLFPFANKGQSVQIYARDFLNNRFMPLEKFGSRGQFDNGLGEFRVVLRLEEEYNASHSLAEDIVRTGKTTGVVTRWFDKSSWMKEWADLATNQAFDRMSGALKELRSIIKPVAHLPLSTQRKIHYIMDKGDQEARWYSYDDIKDLYGQDPDFEQIIQGYDRIRKHQDRVYSMINWGTRNRLVGRGFKELEIVADNDSEILQNYKAMVRRVDNSEISSIIEPVTIRPKSIINNADDVQEAPSVGRIYDADVDEFRTITRSDVVKLNNGELEVYKSFRPLRKKGDRDEIEYILRSTQGSKVKINELPEFVLHKRGGYISRMYDAGYLVTINYKTRRNGVEEVAKQKVIGVENNKKHAMELREHLIQKEVSKRINDLTSKAPGPGEDFTDPDTIKAYEEMFYKDVSKDVAINYSHEFNLSSEGKYVDPTNPEYLLDTGQLYISPRNPEELTGAFDDLITSNGKVRAPRRLVNSVQEALEVSQLHAAKAGTLDLTLEKLVENWKKSYGDLFKEITNGDFPWMRQKLSQPERMNIADKARYDAAVASAEYIKNISGLNESRIKIATRNLIIRTAENLLEGTPRHWKTRMAEGLFKHRNLNVIDKLKSVAFFQLITMRPLRQAILQANQASLYLNRGDYAKYFMSGQGAKEFMGTWMGMLGKSLGNYDSVSPTIYKALGYSKAEYDELIDAYVASGLPASIESHMMIAHSTLDRNLNRFIGDLNQSILSEGSEYARRYANTAHKWIRRMGFDLGEQTQLLGAFLAEKRAWQVANKGKEALWSRPENLTRIAGRARTLSGNMNEAGTLQFQRGALGLASQFLSHATKMMQLLAPRKVFGLRIPGLSNIASEAISDREKYRMMLTQLMMYGSAGLGITSWYEKLRDDFISDYGVEVPQDVSMIVEEGIFGSLLNMGIRLANGEEPISFGERDVNTTDFEISKSLAPVAAAPFWTNANPVGVIVGYLMDTKPEAWDLLGPGFEVFSRMLGSVPTLKHILMDASYLDTDERVKAALLQVASGAVLELDTWQRTRMEMAIGRYLSRTGNEGVTAEEREIFAKALFGIRSRKSRQVGDFNMAVEGVYGGYFKEPDSSTAELKNRAKGDFKHVRRIFELLNKGEVSVEEMSETFKNMAERNFLFMDERERMIYQSELWKNYSNWFTKDSEENQLIKNVIRISTQAETDPMQQSINRILNMNNFEHKEIFADKLRELMY